MFQVLERLKSCRNRDSTRANYHTIWKLFSKFTLKLDIIPELWEDRVFLFLTNLVVSGKKSTTVRSYFSAIKVVLYEDGKELSVDDMKLRSITRACKLANDTLQPRLPIKINLIEMILLELERTYKNQYYLKIMFQTLFAIAYYGLFRIGELARGEHTVLARNVYLSDNKDKVLFVLYSSKTHDESCRPQKIKISSLDTAIDTNVASHRHYCPFKLVTEYFRLRGNYSAKSDQFFVLQDNSPLEQTLVREVLAKAIKDIGLDPRLYTFHGIRAGRATNLFEWGFSLETIKAIGRWKSNAIYKYLKN